MLPIQRVIRARLVHCAIIGLLTLAITGLALAGTALDTSFGSAGYVITDLNTASEEARAVVVQPDGLIVAAGYTDSGSGRDFLILRYTDTGSPDTGFGVNGAVTTVLGPGNDVINAITLQPNGNLVAAGTTVSGTKTIFSVARYISATGDLDASFGAGGIVTTSLSTGNDTARSIAVQADGKIVVGGDANAHFAAVRYNANGTLDTSFGASGHVITTLGAHDIANALLIQPDSKIVLAGHSDQGSSDDFAVARYTISGTLDTSFNFDGKVTTNFGASTNDFALAAALQPDGRIILAGYVSSNGNDFALARYTITGTLDTTFGVGGLKTTTISPDPDEIYGMALQPTGKMVVGGSSGPGGAGDFAVARYLPDGTLDANFGTNGIDLSDLHSGSDDLAYALALQPDNKIILAGSTDNGGASALDVAVARYLSPNQTPTVSDFTQSGLENVNIGFAASNFITNFSDPDGDTLAQIMITALPMSGTLKLNGSAVTLNQEIPAWQLDGLTYVSDLYFFGADSFTWNGSDGIDYAATDASVTLDVAFVNQAPTFTAGPNLSVYPGQYIIPGWATNLSAGPANEAGQVLTFTLTTNTLGLFAIQPAITINGISGALAFTSAPVTYGSATITVTLHDSGGTAHGGHDTSAPQTFVITVKPHLIFLPVVLR